MTDITYFKAVDPAKKPQLLETMVYPDGRIRVLSGPLIGASINGPNLHKYYVECDIETAGLLVLAEVP